MRKLRELAPLIRTLDTRSVPLPPRQNGFRLKEKNPVYDSPEFRAWRTAVVQRAGNQCQAVDEYGNRCPKTRPKHRLYADHIVELRDGGGLLDLNNGQALCSSHHEIKTHAARRARARSSLTSTGGV
jgi:5-methylcytosine-specific restriction enzyme A